ncbi:hypothetical protein [Pseudomonas syringae]|uniref:hypothetical protein n=1 Tax=Pseudomonas syringae TaxID=317 RepID=UPI001BE468A9|nr:hypothetical protein [Pseudomonas syringae]QWB09487.1 hypothetical protein KLC09_24985 [Pseudomonas syringae]
MYSISSWVRCWIICAHVAHGVLYGLMIAMPLTGYLGTGAPTDFGLFSVTGFNETKRLASQLSSALSKVQTPRLSISPAPPDKVICPRFALANEAKTVY